ncbi:hypothetical protein H920_05216 [Fukomys damarensis]|uniref:Uncharacterized protein n=1 Tax=Fukomys damarensis TaxID=885580 RepID=A0A091DS82_FUKDA|nr:hypothetical protein H920_05216 [Fukomys damarensis]
MAQVSHQEHDICQDLPMCKPPGNEDIIQFPEIPLMLKERELAEMGSQATGNQKIGITETFWTSSAEPEKDTSSDIQTATCLNVLLLARKGSSFNSVKKRGP